jgi:cyclase
MRALLLSLLTALPAVAADYPFAYEEVRVAPGITAFIDAPGHAVVSGTIVAIEGDEAVAVVDTGQHPRLTARVAARIREIAKKPVLYVVNTHWHNDHVSGNAVFAEAFPQARFVAHAFTARLIDEQIAPYIAKGCAPFIRSQSAPYRKMVETGRTPEGKEIAPARLERLRSVVVDADAAAHECTEFRYKGSDIAFEERITLKLGHREAQVMWLGRANTAGDALVYVPDAKVLMTGDVLVHPFPFATQSYIGEWAAVLRKVDAMDATTIVPGHGPVMRDRAYLHEVAALMQSIADQVKVSYRDGMPLDELRKHVDVAEHRKRIAGEDPFIGVNLDAAIASSIERAWQQARGELQPEGLPPAEG